MQSRRSFLQGASAVVLPAVAGCTSSPSSDTQPPATPQDAIEDGEPAPAPAGEWTEETPMPVAQSDIASGVVDGIMYCFSGIRSDLHLDATAEGFAYDPTAGDGGEWERMPDLPKALWGMCGVSDGERIFAFGGAEKDSPYQTNRPPTDEIFTFEPGDGWTNLTETEDVRCPYGTWVMQGAYNPVDGLIYNVGGAVFHDQNYTDESDWVWTFDPERAEVVDAPLTTLPEQRRWSTVGFVEVDGAPMLHVMAGQGDDPTARNDRYDIAADAWRPAADVPMPGLYNTHNNPVIDNRIYLTHGLLWSPDEELTNDSYNLVCWAYDPVTDEWDTELAQPAHRRGGSGLGIIDGTLYLAGGHRKDYDGNNYHQATTRVESFTP